jgi:hypothetical protein
LNSIAFIPLNMAKHFSYKNTNIFSLKQALSLNRDYST